MSTLANVSSIICYGQVCVSRRTCRRPTFKGYCPAGVTACITNFQAGIVIRGCADEGTCVTSPPKYCCNESFCNNSPHRKLNMMLKLIALIVHIFVNKFVFNI